jgi:L-galactose dehydrogenase
MQYRRLGITDLEVSSVGFGAASLGGEYGELDPAVGERAVHCAIDLGINYFDVAPYYGGTVAETRLGLALMGKREAVVLATKVGRNRTESGEYFDFSPQGIRESVEASLTRLKTDRIDVLQAHDIEFVPIDVILEQALPEMERLKRDGKIRYVGITAYPLGVLRNVARRRPVDTILSYCRYNLLDTSMDELLTPYAIESEIGLINASVLHMGALTDHTVPNWHPAPASVLATVEKAIEFCVKKGSSISDVALQFAFAHPTVATTLVGMGRAGHVERAARLVEADPDRQLIDEVREILKPVTNIWWQEGIPENFDEGSVPQQS